MEWVIIGSVVLVLTVMAVMDKSCMPPWALEQCHECGSDKVRWLKDQESSTTGEAKFFCKACGCTEHRGGPASELAMQHWEAGK